jgi:hypothetical protein
MIVTSVLTLVIPFSLKKDNKRNCLSLNCNINLASMRLATLLAAAAAIVVASFAAPAPAATVALHLRHSSSTLDALERELMAVSDFEASTRYGAFLDAADVARVINGNGDGDNSHKKEIAALTKWARSLGATSTRLHVNGDVLYVDGLSDVTTKRIVHAAGGDGGGGGAQHKLLPIDPVALSALDFVAPASPRTLKVNVASPDIVVGRGGGKTWSVSQPTQKAAMANKLHSQRHQVRLFLSQI